MTVKLHRCSLGWFKANAHPCWRVEKALKEKGIDYQVVNEPLMRPRRKEAMRLTGQRMLPFVEFEDGKALREESKDLAARIRAGKLFEGRGGAEGAGSTTSG